MQVGVEGRHIRNLQWIQREKAERARAKNPQLEYNRRSLCKRVVLQASIARCLRAAPVLRGGFVIEP
jgi:hypothetical protein